MLPRLSKSQKNKKANHASRKTQHVLWFEEIGIKDVPLVGGKNASLGEMYTGLTDRGIRVPNGFAITAAAYWDFLRGHGLEKSIKKELKGLNTVDIKALSSAGKRIRTLIIKAEFPETLKKEIIDAYHTLAKSEKVTKLSVAVRSSATAEDLPDASFAGQQETYLNVVGPDDLLIAVKKCIASLFTDRAISYRENKGFDHLSVALSVTVQTMVRSETGTSGVMFTIDTESGFPGVVLINASYGLGEYVVKGRVTPDQFYVFKKGLEKGKSAIISKILGSKEVKLVYGASGGTVQRRVPMRERNTICISDEEVLLLAKWGMEIEKFYGKAQDIEWAKDGTTGKMYIVQARPETVRANSDHAVIESFELKKKGQLLLSGISVGQKIGAGPVRVINHPRDMKSFKKGEVLVTRITDPDWEPIMRLASAIVTEQGGKTSHAAIVSRELGVPCVVGAKQARKLIRTGTKVTVSCAEGDEGHIYKGLLPFEVKKTEITHISPTKTKIMMNVGDPDHAFGLSFLPNDGVGLAREEFIFSNFIRIHPLALVHYKKLQDKRAKKKIADLTVGYTDKRAYGVDKLAEGIARIAAAFYPNDVIVRLSDFKTNEYATLIGGKEFEPKEENPMIGWRGASRYYSEEYKPGFHIECEAIKKVRSEWGLENVIVMVPFCRTPEEGQKVLDTMAEFGLKQGEDDLKVYVMCEIPSNVILAEEFAKIFDGFSIGSNDLTQLTLGVDRDSALVSHVYDEKNGAVTELIRSVIKVAHRYKRKVGICGQAPSDYPEFAEFLVREGIDSISLNPDTVLSVRERVAAMEKKVGRIGGRTNVKFLALVGMVAALATGMMLLGGGCSAFEKQSEVSYANKITPAQIRERAEQQAERNRQAERTTFTASSLASFQLDYPSSWSVREVSSPQGFVFSGASGQYVTITRVSDMLERMDENLAMDTIVIDGQEMIMERESFAAGEMIYRMYRPIPNSTDMLMIYGMPEQMFRDIASSIRFVEPGVMPPLPVSDVGAGDEMCIQVITYARESANAECQLFPTPCDVPDGWQVCEDETVLLY